MRPEDQDFLRQLIAETNALPKHAMPGRLAMIVNHPGVLAYEAKTPEQYDEDMRRAHFLDRINKQYDRPVAFMPASLARVATDRKHGKLDKLSSPYDRRGYMAPGAPLHNAMAWWSSLPAVAYAASAKLANAVDPEAPWDDKADDKFNSSLNTLTVYGAEDAGLVPKNTPTVMDVAASGRDARGAVRWDEQLDPRMVNDAISQDTAAKQLAITPDGYSHLKRLGASNRAAMWGGLAMDSIVDPYSNLLPAARLARAGRQRAAAKELMKDFGLGFGVGAAVEAPAVYDQAGQAIRRLVGTDHLEK